MGEWLDTTQAGRLLGMDPGSVAGWAREGRLAGSVKDDTRRWLVKRSEVDRVLAEREETRERRMSNWQPMTQRSGPRSCWTPTTAPTTGTPRTTEPDVARSLDRG